jgi:phage FluMu protein Com
MLTCSHNVCLNFLNATAKNFEEGQRLDIKCPMCRKISEYSKIADVSRNLTLLHIIKNFEEQTIIAFVTVKNPITNAVKVLDSMIADIKHQNEEIDYYFE